MSANVKWIVEWTVIRLWLHQQDAKRFAESFGGVVMQHPSYLGFMVHANGSFYDEAGTVPLKVIKMLSRTFPHEAFENIQETSADCEADIAALLSGEHTKESLLEFCLNGADPDRHQGWVHYVDVIEFAAEGRRLK